MVLGANGAARLPQIPALQRKCLRPRRRLTGNRPGGQWTRTGISGESGSRRFIASMDWMFQTDLGAELTTFS
jgi:hypothetical protein